MGMGQNWVPQELLVNIKHIYIYTLKSDPFWGINFDPSPINGTLVGRLGRSAEKS